MSPFYFLAFSIHSREGTAFSLNHCLSACQCITSRFCASVQTTYANQKGFATGKRLEANLAPPDLISLMQTAVKRILFQGGALPLLSF